MLREGRTSLKVYLQVCEERGVSPYKRFSGRFNVRISPDLHADIVSAAEASGMSLNQWVKKRFQNGLMIEIPPKSFPASPPDIE